MTELGSSLRTDDASQQARFHRPSRPSSPEVREWKPTSMTSRSRSVQRDGMDQSLKRLSIDTKPPSGESEYLARSRSPLLEHEHPPGPSGLPRIRQQPQSRALSMPNTSLSPSTSTSVTPCPSTTSSRAGSTYFSQSALSPRIEDLHRFPSESLHSFSFAQQSEELLLSRHNVLKRSIDFMKDRLGWAAREGDLPDAQAPAGDADLQGMMDLVSETNFLGASDERKGRATGPPLVDGGNVFDAEFGAYPSASPTSYTTESKDELKEAAKPDQFLNPNRAMSQGRDLKSSPSSRRVSLKRTYTDLGRAKAQNKLMDALPHPYATGPLSPGRLSPSGVSNGGGGNSAVHTHSSKWSPVPQAVFRTESKPRWTILAANDLACLVFGITQKEFRKLSILDLVQEERRSWLESKLSGATFEPTEEVPSSEKKSKVTQRIQGMGNGVTSQLLNKPPAREKLARRTQAEDSPDRSKRARSPHHPPTKSRGVLLCGDVIPIQRRNGSTGSASLWVMEKSGGLIWVAEEIVQTVARLQFDDRGRLLHAEGEVEKIWGRHTVTQSEYIFDLLPHVPKGSSSRPSDPDFSKIAELKHFTTKTSSGMEIPITAEPSSDLQELRISSFPHIAGVMVISSTSLDIISANPVFAAALFGHPRPENSRITELIPGFDTFLNILTEEDDVPIVDGMVIPENSFRRARALSILRAGKVNMATLFSQPTGLPARHRDGGEIMVDIQMRVVKSESSSPGDQMPTLGENEELENNSTKSSTSVTEAVFALWITYSRQLHSTRQDCADQILERKLQSQSQQNSQESTPASKSQRARDNTTRVDKSHISLLTQKLNEAASEPLTDKPVEPVPEVNSTAVKKENLKKTINDYVILEDMGQGAYGQVKLARSKRDPNKKVVLKYVTKKRILVDTWTRDRRLGTVPLEIHVLDFLRREHLRHPNIVEMEGFFEDDLNYYIEMTPHGLPGMDLFDYVELRSNMTEAECRNIFRQVVGAIHHLHTKALVVHRDIKDENVVLDGEGRIKLIDFGSAAYIRNGPFDVFVGTIDYAAPEVLQGSPYRGKEQDVWALGILLYTIIYKENPFYNINEIMDHPLRIPFLPFSEDCVELIRKMLDREVEQRLAIDEVMEHPWMKATTNGTALEL